MSGQDYFQIYIDTISDALKRVRKIGFKKFNLVKDLVDTVQNFLAKQVEGRIEPANYLLALVVLLGSKTPKLYSPIISAIQRLFAYNFIAPNEDLSASLKLLKQQHKQFLLLSHEDYNNKTFKEIYIQTLVNLGEKDEGLNINVAKTLSLIWRLDQNSIPEQLLSKIFDYLLDCMVTNRLQQEQKLIKSVVLQIFRHSLESYRQAHDRKFLYQDNNISVKNLVNKYGQMIADTVAIHEDLSPQSPVLQFRLVPLENQLQNFKSVVSKARNEKGTPAGKFGWCINCRNTANYYCKVNRLPVCSYQCKHTLLNEISSLQKFVDEEQRSFEVFQAHIIEMFNLFKKYLVHSDVKKKVSFSQIFVLMASQIKKITDKLSPKMYFQLRKVVRHVMVNVYAQSEAFLPCMATLKKLLQLRIFLDQTQVLLRLFAKKLQYFLTPPNIRDQILRFIRDLINNRLLFDAVMQLDCSPNHFDAVREVIDALRQVYIGIPVPQTITIPPSEDLNAKRMCLQICLQLLKYLQQTDKKMHHNQAQMMFERKNKLNKIRANIQRFNNTEKPLKVVKKLIEEGFLPKDPEQIAKFLHTNLKRLNSTNIGQLIGDIDDFAGQIRKHFIGQINFTRLPIDEGMRHLLKHFTLPGESQVVQRIIETFGITYFNQNRQGTVFVNSDAVYSFSYLLMMLQSNLHNPQVIQKMTLPQYSKLSIGMNGSAEAEFPPAFLQEIYNSVQKKPLGVHEKLKEIQILIAYNTNPKKAIQIYQKQSQRQGLQKAQNIEMRPIEQLSHFHNYPISIFIQEFICQIIDMLTFRIKDLEQRQKQEIIKSLQLIEGALRISYEWNVPRIIQRGIQKIWQEIQRTNIISKKYILMQAMLEWVRKFEEMLSEQWRVVIFLISRFNRSKSIRKDQSNKNHSPITIIENRCFLFDSYIEQIMNKSTKITNSNLVYLLKALLGVSREQTNEGPNPFCLEKIIQVLQLNSARSVDILNSFWSDLRDYFIQLGRHKNEKVSLFASDFLKQMVTKFLKRKDLLNLQRDYLKPFEQIFNTSKSFAVKELMIGALSYFVNNYPTHLKTGWKTILTVVNNSFEDEQHQVIKEKAYAILKKISESNFTIFNLEQNYTDFVQILNKLTRQKQETYAFGCLQIIQLIVEYYHQRLGIDLQKSSQAVQNAHIDINFWQTVFLPLLSIIFPMCGDSRAKVQAPAIKTLFEILTKYGKLFRYQFWKMVLQGVLRPAFEEITYTSQSKPLKKDELQKWLNYSFTQLFHSINELIVLYYQDFQLFLEDVFKIYENCIINHSLILLIELSFKALNNLLEKIAPNFQEHDWEIYLSFAQSLMKKTLPTELSSLEAWNKSKDLLETNHEAKCFALQTFLNKIQIIFEKYPHGITEKIYLDVLREIEPIYTFISDFNSNIELRVLLWKNGFYQDQRSLPGLIRHQYEILSFRSKIYLKLIQFDEKYIHIYFRFFLEVMTMMKSTVLETYVKEPTLKDIQREKFAMYYRKLLNEVLFEQLKGLGVQMIKKVKMQQKILQQCLDLMGRRVYCSRCSFCEHCENSGESWITLNNQLQQIILILFKGK